MNGLFHRFTKIERQFTYKIKWRLQKIWICIEVNMDLILESKTVSNTIQMRHKDADDQFKYYEMDKKLYCTYFRCIVECSTSLKYQ